MRNITPDATAFDLADCLALARMREETARAERIEIEERLRVAVGFDQTSGSKTYPLTSDDCDVEFRVEFKQPIKATVRAAEWEAMREQIPKPLRPVRVKYEADAKKVKALREKHPDLYLLFTRAYSTAPGKVGVTFKD